MPFASSAPDSTPQVPQPPLPLIADYLVESTFGTKVAERGGQLVEADAVERIECVRTASGTKGELVGVVIGSAGDRSRTRVSVQRLHESFGAFRRSIDEAAEASPLDALELWMPAQSTCSCPVAMNCKHGAALSLESGALAEAWAMDPANQAELQDPDEAAQSAEWKQALAAFLQGDEADAVEESTPLALGFELFSEQLKPSRFSWGNEQATREHLEAGKNLFLAMYPLRRGKRSNWIKGGLSWRSFEFRMPETGLEPAHSDALTRIFALAESERSYTYGAVEQLWLNTFRSPLVWESLVRARDAGVAFVGVNNVASVSLGNRGEVSLDLRGTDRRTGSDTLTADASNADAPGAAPTNAAPPSPAGPVRLVPTASIDGEVLEDARPLGASGVIAARPLPGKAEKFELRIAPTETPMPQHLQNLLGRGEPVTVPARDREQFFTQALPRLSRIAPVASADGSVEIPKPKPPRLHLQALYAGKNALELTWFWEYPSTKRRFSLHIDRTAGRDRDSEDALLAEVREFWPTVGGALPGTAGVDEGTELLNDVDTAVFTTHALPQLEAMEGVKVDISGTRHEYRELDAAPQVTVTQTENKQKTDWFDLGFNVTVEGRTIPFPSLFVALAKGQSKLMLEDRTYFSLEHEAFDQLRQLIAEGEALAEWEPEHLQVSKFQVGFFADIVDAADHVEMAAAWQNTVGKLKDLTAIPEAPLPQGLRAQLRPYQHEGFRYLAFLHSLGLGGILADDMGLGKTLQALSLIQHDRESAELPEDGIRRPFLVVAPSSVVGVWEQEAARFTPDLRVAVLNETRRKRGTYVRDAIAGADVVITSYTILRIDSEEFAREQFAGMILDEAQFVKNRSSRVHQSAKRIKASFRLAITGTPMENSLTDLWSLLSLTAPGVLGNAVQFRTEFVQPIESGEHPEKMSVLRRRVRPFMLRRTKELVAKDLPEKQEQTLRVELEPAHRRLYDRVLQRERKKVLGLLNGMDKNRFIVFRSLTLLRMLALDPAIVNDGENEDVPSSKLVAMLERLEEIVGEGHRVLVFSQFTSFLGRVGEALDQRGINHSYLDGSTRGRADVIRDFREGENPVFLISLKAGGFGLTLTEADYVFLLDPWWNPAAENQAIDRAHRIGQSERVMVYRMVAEDTIEDKVLALQEKKRALFDSLTDEGDAFAKSVSAEELKSLFE